MAIKIKPVADIARKWGEVTPARATIYKTEIEALTPDEWEKPTIEAEGTWERGVSEAATRKAFSAGVKGRGDKWKRKALELGPVRYGPGVTAAIPDYEAEFAPYRDTIAAIVLPPRGPRGDPANYERVKAVGTALFEKRIKG